MSSKSQNEMKKILDESYKFCIDEAYFSDQIIDLLEYNVNRNKQFRLEYNGIPVKVGSKTLIRLHKRNTEFDRNTYAPFRPMRNLKHCNLVYYFIQEDEPERNLSFITIRKKLKDGTFRYISELRDNDEVLSIGKSSLSETRSRFICLYVYLYGDSKEFRRKLKKIDVFDSNSRLIKKKKKEERENNKNEENK